jgi:hypothetical protein
MRTATILFFAVLALAAGERGGSAAAAGARSLAAPQGPAGGPAGCGREAQLALAGPRPRR